MPAIELDLWKLLIIKINVIKTRFNIANQIVCVQINSKFHDKKNYQSKIFIIEDYILLQLYKSYNILFILN